MQITAKELTFTYNKKTVFKKVALNSVNLDIQSGEFYGIIGHTGSGKSTFIQHLNAILTVESGSLKVGEFDLSNGKKDTKKQLKDLRKKVGMVFQYPEYQLFAETVYEDVAFGYKNFYPQATEEEIKTAVLTALSLVGLDGNVLNKSPFDLSGGQRRRVAIAGVIVTKPEVLVLDEPVAGLDPVGKKELWKLLHSLHKSSCKTVIVVSHDMDEMAENCTRLAVFSEGKVAIRGTTAEVFSRSEELTNLRLTVPVTGYLKDGLNAKGFSIDTDFTEDDFVNKFVELYNGINGK